VQGHGTIFAVDSPGELPGTTVNHKYFFSVMAMVRVLTAFGLPRSADVKAMGYLNVDNLIWVFCHTLADKAKIFFFIAARCTSVDKGRFARHHVVEAHDTRFDFFMR
jgi:hypothetical protein